MARRLPLRQPWQETPTIISAFPSQSGLGEQKADASPMSSPTKPIGTKFTPEELQYDKAGTIFNNYFESESFKGPFIQAYDVYMTRILGEQIHSRECLFRNEFLQVTHKAVFEVSKIVPPTDTPEMCRLNNLTYSATIYLTCQIFSMLPSLTHADIFEIDKPISAPFEFELGKMPVMVGSRLFDVAGTTETERTARGECPKDPGGYFNIRGGEKVIVPQEKLLTNHFFTLLGKQEDKRRVTCEIVTANIYGTGSLVLYEGNYQTVEAHLIPFGKIDRKTPVKVNVYQIFRMMAQYSQIMADYYPEDQGAIPYADPQNITQLILRFVPKIWQGKAYTYLAINETIAMAITDDIKSVETNSKGNLTAGGNFLQRIDNAFFAQMTNPSHRRLPMLMRLQLLAMMVARTVEVMAKLRLPDDRDDWANKRIDISAKSIEILMCKIWADRVNKLQKGIEKGDIRINNIAEKLADKRFPITADIIKSFSGQHWGSIGAGRKQTTENIVETLKREYSILSIYASMRRLSAQINPKTRVETIRMVQNSQYGFICTIETPEGPRCGIVKHMTTMCSPSIEQDENILETLLREGNYLEDEPLASAEGVQEVYQRSSGETRNAAVLLNGRFLGWANGPKLRMKLVGLRRQRLVEKDTSFVLQLEGPITPQIMRNHILTSNGLESNTAGESDKIYTLFINTDSGRPTRPLLIVNKDTNRLVIEEKEMWTASWPTLLSQGCVEYISAAEQHYINIATSMWDFEGKRAEIAEVQRRLDIANYEMIEYSTYSELYFTKKEKEEKQTEIDQLTTLLKKLRNTYIYTHCEIDPAALMGTSASIIPMPQTNQAPRNTYQCLLDTEEILMADGSYKMLRDIQDGNSVLTVNPDNFTESISQIYNKRLNNPKENSQRIFRITMLNGREILATHDHEFLAQARFGFIEAQWLNPKIHMLAMRVNDTDPLFGTPQWELCTETGSGKNVYIPIQSVIELTEQPNCLVGCFTTLSANHTYVTRSGFISHNCGMGKQSIGIYASNELSRFETTTKIMAYPTQPTFQPQILKMLGFNELPSGIMVTMAIMAWTGFNQEDAIIINEDAIKRGLFMMKKQSTVKAILENSREKNDKIENPLRIGLMKPGDSKELYAALDDNGLPKLDYFVTSGMYIIGIVRHMGSAMENISEKLGPYEQGVIDHVYVGVDDEGRTVVKVKLREVRKMQEGWKLAPRMAQKGTVARIVPGKDMPRIAHGRNRGVAPSIIINPHSIPSRMTISLIIEFIISKVGDLHGEHQNATAFRPFDMEEFERSLRDYGYDDYGWELMMDSRTGEPFTSQTPLNPLNDLKDEAELRARIYVGPCLYQALKHQPEDKRQVRSVAEYDKESHQPVKGRKHHGGIRFGEMEKGSLISHGAAEMLHDTMCLRSDPYEAIFCLNCGNLAYVEDIDSTHVKCRICGFMGKSGQGLAAEVFGRTLTTYASIRQNRLLQAMGLQTVHTKFLSKKSSVPPIAELSLNP